MTWKSEDPRHSINKRANIVVLYPDNTGYHRQAVAAQVETKHGWNIAFSSYDRSLVTMFTADDDWPEGWLWTFQPRREQRAHTDRGLDRNEPEDPPR